MKHKMKPLAAILIFSISSTSVLAEWKEIGAGGSADGTNIYSDLQTLQHVNGMPRIWVMTDYQSPQQSERYLYSSAKILQEFDCKAMTSAQISGIAYSGNMGAGNVMQRWSKPHEPVIPETVGQYLYNFFCSLEKLRTKK